MSDGSFICAICEREIRADAWRQYRRLRGDDAVPPLCLVCEQPQQNSSYGMGGKAGCERVRHGTFMDRRIAHQLGNLAVELEWLAKNKIWKATHHGA
jgi:hypothetical protein